MRFVFNILTLVALFVITSCAEKTVTPSSSNPSLTFEIKNLTDQEYPDNPDIGFRSKDYQNNFFTMGEMEAKSKGFFYDFRFISKNADTIRLDSLNISEFIPTIPSHVMEDKYLTYLSIINQEWNRNQIKFKGSEFKSSFNQITRVDVARNCLNAYLWEVILYIEEDGKEVPYAHGWFDFPHELYAELFEHKNQVAFQQFKAGMENWIDPQSKKVNLNALRTIKDTIEISYHDLSDKMYPIKAARLKKFKEVIYPDSFLTMRDLQSDSSLFATFTPPGFYNKKDPRKTELGRFFNLQSVKMSKILTKPVADSLQEIELIFKHKNDSTLTKLVFGGINLNSFPVLNEAQANKGWKSSMGIGNHPFYETYANHLKHKTKASPYYAMLLDENGRWLDSHAIGIDGPIFHFSDEDKSILNLWLLSFERHALIGHYQIKIN